MARTHRQIIAEVFDALGDDVYGVNLSTPEEGIPLVEVVKMKNMGTGAAVDVYEDVETGRLLMAGPSGVQQYTTDFQQEEFRRRVGY